MTNHEFNRLKEAMRRKETSKVNVDIATVIDGSMKNTLGYVTAQMADGTPINVHAWTSDQVVEGAQIHVQPMTTSQSNWYALVGVNVSTDVEANPYSPPLIDPESLPSHELGGELHSGLLPWAKVSTEASKVELVTQTNGFLPKTRQEPQASRQQLSFSASVSAGGNASGQLACPRYAWVRRILVEGGSMMTLTFREDDGAVEYQTTSVATPYEDYRGYCHAADDGFLRWELASSSGGVFTVTLEVVGWI